MGQNKMYRYKEKLARRAGYVSTTAFIYMLILISLLYAPKTIPLISIIRVKHNLTGSLNENVIVHQEFCKTIIHERYDSLRNRTYYLAINLHNNEEVLAHLLTSVNKFIEYVGPERVFLSIFESGSTDETKSLLSKFIFIFKCSFKVETSPISNNVENPTKLKKYKNHRIDFLVHVRNKAMNPFYSGVAVKKQFAQNYEANLDYDSILFINDIYFCANDLLELEYQRVLNKGGMASGMDYVRSIRNSIIFYDSWVALDRNGYSFRSSNFDNIYRDTESAQRGKEQLPLQVTCAWNGMVSLSTIPFKNGYKFRRGTNGTPAEKTPGECSTSECQTLCLDYIKTGSSRIIMVPRVKVAYSWSDYLMLKKEGDYYDAILPDQPFKPTESVPIPFRKFSPKFHCQPNYDGHRGIRITRGEYFEAYPAHKSPDSLINTNDF
eukprot:NODE_37_length_31305_cov_0.348939.p6 type:complete len:436 gc:universal NODE_37_length_31305_cov_0.348939:5247-6554(+)